MAASDVKLAAVKLEQEPTEVVSAPPPRPAAGVSWEAFDWLPRMVMESTRRIRELEACNSSLGDLARSVADNSDTERLETRVEMIDSFSRAQHVATHKALCQSWGTLRDLSQSLGSSVQESLAGRMAPILEFAKETVEHAKAGLSHQGQATEKALTTLGSAISGLSSQVKDMRGDDSAIRSFGDLFAESGASAEAAASPVTQVGSDAAAEIYNGLALFEGRLLEAEERVRELLPRKMPESIEHMRVGPPCVEFLKQAMESHADTIKILKGSSKAHGERLQSIAATTTELYQTIYTSGYYSECGNASASSFSSRSEVGNTRGS